MEDIENTNQFVHMAKRISEQSYAASEATKNLADDTVMKAVKDLQGNSAASQLLADVERNESIVRATQGPLEEFRRTGFFDKISDLYDKSRPINQIVDDLNERFTLPDLSTTEMLMKAFDQSSVVEAMARYSIQDDDILRAIEAMHTPWLDTQEALRSVTSLVEIQGIGKMLASMPAFDTNVCSALRDDLGDWRGKIDWQELELTDLPNREAFYIDRGFDTSLTDFPASAFRESTEIAGLKREPPPLIAAYSEPVSRASYGDDEEAFIMTNKAHDWLQRLESQLRKFINDKMTEAFGSNWPKHQLPRGFYEQWVKKRDTAMAAGRKSFPLIAYADFSEYEVLICRKDNWNKVFRKYYKRKESIRESFQRLHPIRIDTMHSRPIVQDDQLLLYVEVRRLVSVIDS